MPTKYLEGERSTKVKVMARKWQEPWAVGEDKEESEDMNRVTDVKKQISKFQVSGWCVVG